MQTGYIKNAASDLIRSCIFYIMMYLPSTVSFGRRGRSAGNRTARYEKSFVGDSEAFSLLMLFIIQEFYDGTVSNF